MQYLVLVHLKDMKSRSSWPCGHVASGWKGEVGWPLAAMASVDVASISALCRFVPRQ